MKLATGIALSALLLIPVMTIAQRNPEKVAPQSGAIAQPPMRGGEGFSDKDKQEWKERAEKKHEKRMERLTKDLNLTKEQADNISKIVKDGWEKISAEMKKMRETTRSFREATDSQIEKLLSPEQVEKFKNVREKMKKKFKERAKKWKKHSGKPCGVRECPPEAPVK